MSPEVDLLSIFSEASSHPVDAPLAPSPQAYTQMVLPLPFLAAPPVAHQQLLNKAGAMHPSCAQDIGSGTLGTIEMTSRRQRDVENLAPRRPRERHLSLCESLSQACVCVTWGADSSLPCMRLQMTKKHRKF